MTLLEKLIYHREKLLKSLSAEKVAVLQPLLDRPKKKLIYDVWHTWMLENWGVSVIEDGERVPRGLVPDVDDFAKYMSNMVKGLI